MNRSRGLGATSLVPMLRATRGASMCPRARIRTTAEPALLWSQERSARAATRGPHRPRAAAAQARGV